MSRIRSALIFLAAASANAQEVAPLTVTSPAFSDGGDIPADFTCDGRSQSPPIAWSQPPSGTRSVVVLVEDPDAPRGTFEHLVLFNLQPSERSLPSQPAERTVGTGGVTALNDNIGRGFAPICPPGGPHRYRFSVMALDRMLPLKGGETFGDVSDALRGHILAQGELTGVYRRR
jgi:Raf kinase inhibitor-like YbhB/YbcL family protein